MFKIENKNILVSNGDYGQIDLTAVDTSTGVKFVFNQGDKIEFRVSDFYRQKILIDKTIYVVEPTDTIVIELEGIDTDINDDTINPHDFVYDIVYNDVYSLVCFSDEVQPLFRVFPRHRGE